MKKTQAIALALISLIAWSPASSSAESRHPNETTAQNPIIIESQIKDITRDGDAFVITLHRQIYAFIAWPTTRVRLNNGDRMDVHELRPEDYIRVYGDLRQNTVYADRILVLGRVEHRN